MSTTIILTQGHISIRRGKVTRQYHPTTASYNRLWRAVQGGPCDGPIHTNRSTLYVWHSLSRSQRAVYDLYISARAHYTDTYNAIVILALHNLDYDRGREHRDYAYALGAYTATLDACQALSIHPVLLRR